MTSIRAILLKVAAAFFLIAGAQAAGATTYTGTFGYTGPIRNSFDSSVEDFDFSATFQITFGQHPVETGLANLVPDAFALTIGTASFDASNARFSVRTGLLSDPEIFVFHFGGISGGVGGGIGSTNPVPDFLFQVHYNTETGALSNFFLGVSRPLDSPEGLFYGGGSPDGGLSDGTFSFSISPNPGSPNPGAVPEPATWLLMIAGLAATGGSLRMRAARLAAA